MRGAVVTSFVVCSKEGVPSGTRRSKSSLRSRRAAGLALSITMMPQLVCLTNEATAPAWDFTRLRGPAPC